VGDQAKGGHGDSIALVECQKISTVLGGWFVASSMAGGLLLV